MRVLKLSVGTMWFCTAALLVGEKSSFPEPLVSFLCKLTDLTRDRPLNAFIGHSDIHLSANLEIVEVLKD